MTHLRVDLMAKLQSMMRRRFLARANVLAFLLAAVFVFLCVRYYLPERECQPGRQGAPGSKLKYRLIALILSSPDSLERRNTIRKTWLAERDEATMKHLFVVGTQDILPEQRNTLQSEKQKFDDLLLLPRLQDSYGTLTKKVLHTLKAVYEHYDFDYLLKCDDDSYVLVHKILKELDKWQSKGTKRELYWGFFNGRAQVKRSGPWKETDWILCDYYLPYAVGGGYVLSYNLVEFIAAQS